MCLCGWGSLLGCEGAPGSPDTWGKVKLSASAGLSLGSGGSFEAEKFEGYEIENLEHEVH